MYKVLNFLDGKKTIIGFIAIFVYAGLIQFLSVPNEPIIWGFIATWTGVSGVVHINKV